MKTLIIYQSIHHGNTKKVAEVIASVLKADIKKPEQVDLKSLKDYDLIGFGSGIYAWRHHQSLFDLITRLPQFNNKPAFIFSTSGKGGISLHQKLKVSLIGKGFKILSEFACKGWDTFGPFAWFGGLNKGQPNEKDLEKAENFAKDLLKK